MKAKAKAKAKVKVKPKNIVNDVSLGNPSDEKNVNFEIMIDSILEKLPLSDKDNLEVANNLRNKCLAANQISCNLQQLLTFSDTDHWMCLDFLASLNNCLFQDGEITQTNLFDAVLNLQISTEKTEEIRKWKKIALEVTAFCFPDSLEIACNQIKNKMSEWKIKGIQTKALIAEAKEILSIIRNPAGKENQNLIMVKEIFPEAPVNDKVVIPAGWALTDKGITRTTASGDDFSAPVVITECGSESQRGSEFLTIAWKKNDRWKTRIVNRKEVADQRTIIASAEFGLPVTSVNSRTLVKYLEDFESANLANLPSVRVSGRMGWQGENGRDGFLWGRNLITADRINFDGEKNGAIPLIRFRTTEPGEEQLADGFHQMGDYDEWIKAVKTISTHPKAMVAFYAAFLPPMLQVLRTPNHVIDFAGITSCGKSTVLRVIASVWGNPIEGSSNSVLLTWNGTATWRERVPVVCSDLPFILDDTKNVTFPEEVAKTIYSVVQGRGRGRGTIHGLALQGHCNTVLFSSGEQSAIGFTKDGGTRPRVLSFWGSPFGNTDLQAGQLARNLTMALGDHFGHAGPRFIQYLLTHSKKWNIWQNKYKQRVKHYEELAGDNFIAGRMSVHFAAIRFTSRLVHRALSLPWVWTDPIEPVWDDLVSTSGDGDTAARALQGVYNWCVAHKSEFYSDGDYPTDKPPLKGFAGRWDLIWDWIGIMPQILSQVLSELKFEEDAIIRSWKDRGWLITDTDNRNVKKIKILLETPRLVTIRRSAIEALT